MAHTTSSIVIVPYRESWPAEFRLLAEPMRSSLDALAMRIDHIGSTAVPGLAAKDIVDIQVTVSQLDSAVERGLNAVGYGRVAGLREDHVPPHAAADPGQWTKWVFTEREGRLVHVHVRVAGRANQRYPLLFRDFLRTNALARDAYGQLKVALARLHPDDKQAYYDVKDPACDLIMAGAEVWATSVSWTPGPSDA